MDPIDICVVSERPIARSEVIVSARVVGGLQVIDNEEADDKIIAVLATDQFWASANDVTDLPAALVERLRHYFSTYKLVPGAEPQISIERLYGADHAQRVIEASLADYDEEYGS